jgi:hypothetical protein
VAVVVVLVMAGWPIPIAAEAPEQAPEAQTAPSSEVQEPQETQPDAPPAETGAEAPPENTVEADAQAYIRLVLRHDFLVFKEGMRTLTDAERNEMPPLRARGAEIQQKYAPGGPMAAQGAEYQQRVKELSSTRVVAARAEWITNAFPTADAIVAAFPDDPQRLAALQILQELLEYSVRPAPPATAAKRNSYRQAIDKISPPAEFDARLYEGTREFRQSRQFQLDVINRFVPAFAADAEIALQQEQVAEAEYGDLFMFWSSLGATCIAALGLPLIFLFRGQRSPPGEPHSDPAFRLPAALAKARTFGRTHGFSFEFGRVTAKDRDGAVLEMPDGQTIRTGLLGLGYEVGHIVGFVYEGPIVVASHNYSAGGVSFNSPQAAKWSELPIDRLFWTSFGLVVAGFTAISYFVLPAAMEWNRMLGAAVGAWGLLMFLVLYFYIGFLNNRVITFRERKYEEKWEPRLLDFMTERTPAVLQAMAVAAANPRKGRSPV